MQKKFMLLTLPVIIGAFLGCKSVGWTHDALKPGSQGAAVMEVQTELYQLQYLNSVPTGYFGRRTLEAVRAFQWDHGLKRISEIGDVTRQALKAAVLISLRNNSRNKRWVMAFPWQLADKQWRRGENARIIDIETGKTFWVRRMGGHFHSDTEPLNNIATRTLREIYNGEWSWKRRAVIVEIGDQRMAGSINGYPHGRSTISDNGFSGHFCVHFLGSKIHRTNRMDPEHQKMIGAAVASKNKMPYVRSKE